MIKVTLAPLTDKKGGLEKLHEFADYLSFCKEKGRVFSLHATLQEFVLERTKGERRGEVQLMAKLARFVVSKVDGVDNKAD